MFHFAITTLSLLSIAQWCSSRALSIKCHLQFCSKVIAQTHKTHTPGLLKWSVINANDLQAVDFTRWFLLWFRRLFIAMSSICTARYIQKLCKVCASTTATRPAFKCVVKHWRSGMMSTTTSIQM